IIYTFGEVSGIGQISTFTLAQAGEAHRGKALALTDFVRSVGQAVTPLLLIFQSVIGFGGVFFTLIGFGLLAILFVIRAYKIQEGQVMSS
ncbi:MAG: hypothetical protein ACRCZC_07035, partial [Culicoidibacterales bacterium]